MRKSCVTKRPEGDSSANLGRVCTASDMRGRAGREPGGWGAPRCHCGASAGPKRSEVSIRPGTGQGARVSILPQEGAQGAACPGPGGGRARQARHQTTRTTPRHTCGRSRPRGEVTRAGSQGRGNGASRALRPPGKGSSHGMGFLGKLKAERAHGPAVPLVGVYPKEPRPGPSAPRVPRGSGTVPDVRAPSTDEDDAARGARRPRLRRGLSPVTHSTGTRCFSS